jgi:hypothetical protein
MRFNDQAKYRWHKWFALWPVQIGVTEYAWLEMVERKRIVTWDGFYFHEYRAISSASD